MPMTKIYLREGSTPEFRLAVSDAIHRSLIDVLGIPEDDKFHVFHEMKDDFLISAPVAFGLERRRSAIFIQYYFAQRPAETLRELYSATIATLQELTELEPRDVYINLVPSPSENWWAAGRSLDPTTGFDVRMDTDALPPRR
jgi:phenylpyruvate tautomerase PptA (4-oxalocrotonate tautomerase family)